MRDVLKANKGRVKSTISVHSYSQLWMSPYGYQSSLPADYKEMVCGLIELNATLLIRTLN